MTQSAAWASATIISPESQSLHLGGYCFVEKSVLACNWNVVMVSELLMYFPLHHCLQIYHLIGFCPAVTRVWPQKIQKMVYFWERQRRKVELSLILYVFLNSFCFILVEKYHKLCFRVEVNTFLSSYFSSYFQQGLAWDFIAAQSKLSFVPVALCGSWYWQEKRMKKPDGRSCHPPLCLGTSLSLVSPKAQAGGQERWIQGLIIP